MKWSNPRSCARNALCRRAASFPAAPVQLRIQTSLHACRPQLSGGLMNEIANCEFFYLPLINTIFIVRTEFVRPHRKRIWRSDGTSAPHAERKARGQDHDMLHVRVPLWH